MFSIISPAKTMDFKTGVLDSSTAMSLHKKTKELLSSLRRMDFIDLQNILGTSKNLTELNFDRCQHFVDLPCREAIYAYDGDVYRHIDRNALSAQDIRFMDEHVGIISGFYGLLAPSDPIRPYRLEMKSSVPDLAPKGLAHFWHEEVTDSLNERIKTHKNKIVINLASNEYSKSIDRKRLDVKVIDVNFLQERAGVYKNIAINAKRARGMLLNYIVKNRLDSPNELQRFDEGGYKFASDLSDDGNYVFVRKE